MSGPCLSKGIGYLLERPQVFMTIGPKCFHRNLITLVSMCSNTLEMTLTMREDPIEIKSHSQMSPKAPLQLAQAFLRLTVSVEGLKGN